MPDPDREPLGILILGRDTCEDTTRSRIHLTRTRVPFRYLSFEHDPETEAVIRIYNSGDVKTPTILIGDPDHPTHVLVEPSDEDLDRAIVEAGGGL
jgi:glutaredoxin